MNWTELGGIGRFGGLCAGKLAQPAYAAQGRRLDRSGRTAKERCRLGLTQLLPVPQHDHHALRRRQMREEPHEHVPDVDSVRSVGPPLGCGNHWLPVPDHASAPPAIGSQVVERAPQVAFGVGIDSPVVPQQSFQRGLQQILAIWRLPASAMAARVRWGRALPATAPPPRRGPASLCPVSGSGFTPSPPSCFLPAKDVRGGPEVATGSRFDELDRRDNGISAVSG